MNKKDFFCRQLAATFYHADWHYLTLLGAAIDSVDELPANGNVLINELLLEYPEKPTEQAIEKFLRSSINFSYWFRNRSTIKLVRYNLESPAFTEQLNQQHPPLDTPKDLADWLAITPSELNWFIDLKRYDASTPKHLQHYQYQLLEKRDGRMRLIEKPKTRLKRLQKQIYDEILSGLETHPAVHGFCPGRGCVSHASVHVGKRYLLLFDIEQCFQSIGWAEVKSVFARMGYPNSVSTHLTALCTHRVCLTGTELKGFEQSQRDRLRQRHLPQGAPSSPALMNAVLHRLDKRLTGLARSLGMDYSRYADDIALSSNEHRDWRFLEPIVGGICLDEGVALNHRKTRIKRSHQRQRVVGVVVNKKVNIDRKSFDTLHAILTNCARHGLKSQNIHSHPNFEAHLLGRIQHVKSLNENRGKKLEKVFASIDRNR